MKSWKYRVTIYASPAKQNQEDDIIVTSPIACKGTISRGVFSNSNKAEIELFNLASKTRDQIYQDPYQDADNSKLLRVEVGYSEDDTVQQVFFGRILQAYSMKTSGSTEVVTKISALCLDLFNMSSITFEAGTSKRDAIKTLKEDLPNISSLTLGNVNGEFKTPTTFDGNTLEQINKIAGGSATIDNDHLSVCLLNEVIDVPVPIISNDNVLLDTPMRKGMQLELNFIMQPYLMVNQLLQIDSKIFSTFNGQYKVIGFTHNFLISESVAGQKTTKATVLIGDMLNSSPISVSGDPNYRTFNKVKVEQITPVKGEGAKDISRVYQYIKNHSGTPPTWKVVGNITWYDLLKNDNWESEILQEINIPKLANCYVTATNVFKIANQYFKGKRISVNSCWRSVRNNKKWGGKANSKHLQGLAMDFLIDGVSRTEVYNLFAKAWGGGIGYVYTKKGFVHVQIDHINKLVNDV